MTTKENRYILLPLLDQKRIAFPNTFLNYLQRFLFFLFVLLLPATYCRARVKLVLQTMTIYLENCLSKKATLLVMNTLYTQHINIRNFGNFTF